MGAYHYTAVSAGADLHTEFGVDAALYTAVGVGAGFYTAVSVRADLCAAVGVDAVVFAVVSVGAGRICCRGCWCCVVHGCWRVCCPLYCF